MTLELSRPRKERWKGRSLLLIVVLHANWTRGALHLWAESAETSLAAPGAMGASVAQAWSDATHPCLHGHALPAPALRDRLLADLPFNPQLSTGPIEPSSIRLRLPGVAHGPWPSDHLRLLTGAAEPTTEPRLATFEVPTLALPPASALEILGALDDAARDGLALAPSVRFFIRLSRLAIDMLAAQRFIPTLLQMRGNGVIAAWLPWTHDDETHRALSDLLAAMPPAVRAVVDDRQGQPWPILEDALAALVDAFVRQTLARESFIDALDGRDARGDAHVAWLSGLLGPESRVDANSEMAVDLLRDAGAWVGRLADTGQDRPLHLLLKVNEPLHIVDARVDAPIGIDADDGAAWTVSLHVQSSDDPTLIIDAQAVWSGLTVESRASNGRVEQPEELLLAELGRVSPLWPRIEDALAERAPTHITLNTLEAYEFLRDIKPLMEESGVRVAVPAWWNQPVGRLGARLQIDVPPAPSTAADSASPASSTLGLQALVDYRWQIAIGDQPLTMEEFEALARQPSPLVRVRGNWIEINPEQLRQAREFILKSPTGRMTLLEAIQAAHGASTTIGSELPIFGMDASGWVADILNASSDDAAMPRLEQPESFHGSLRPYQRSGLSWLSFLDYHGLGACLADDMGLGKTIQFIAMLLHERSGAQPEEVGPTLLIVPTSVVENWVRELDRFGPSLRPLVHHGPDRATGERFVDIVRRHDLVITTYPLVARDHETLRKVNWHRVTLDEAQYIKNPPTKQTAAIRSLNAKRRLALTGTPVENRLSELWSIMEFLNPGYLGAAGEFRRRFAVPIERHRNQRQAERLRQMVRPFVLRRLKTDPRVIDDLPPCVETKEFATLTSEQAVLYQQVVNSMLGEVDRATGMQRRGLVLATLVKLKQICNHPAQYLGGGGARQASQELVSQSGSESDGELPEHLPLAPLASEDHAALRSGKAKRLVEMLEEVLATDEKALIFTQFRQMGHLLASMIQRELDIEPLFLHGGTPASKRQALIDRFQTGPRAAPVFILSLKAGGVGLNLTAASHVFHFDRWWNPAVENQATDRAFRIGQTRRVHVHKFVCLGTLEERIDQMIEQKTELAQNIIGSGEQWLTELSTGQLRDLLTLRASAMEVDA